MLVFFVVSLVGLVKCLLYYTNPDGSGSYDIELMQAISSYLETYHQTPVLKEKPIAPIKSITRKIYDKETGEIFAEVPRDLSFRKAGLEDDMGIT